MGRYDKEKEAMGLKPTSSTSAPKKKSRYAKEREEIKSGTMQKPSELTSAMASSVTRHFDAKELLSNLSEVQGTREQPVLRGKLNTDKAPTEKQQKQLDKELNKGLRKGFGTPYFGQLQTPMELISEGVMEAGNAATLGIPDAVTGRTLANRADYEKTAAGTAGKIIGELAPISRGYNLVKPLFSGVKNTLARTAVRGATVGAGFGTAKEIADAALDTRDDGQQSIGKRALNVGTEAALFAGGDTAITGLSTLAKKYAPSIIQSLTKRNQLKESVVPEVEEVTQKAFNDYGKQAGPENADSLIGKIFDEVSQRTTPPLENPKELFKYVKRNLSDIPDTELRKLNYDDLAELAEEVRKGTSVADVSRQVAKDFGYEWDDIIKSAEIGATKIEGTPSRYAKERESIQEEKPSRYAAEREAIKPADELKFAQTVKQSENSSPELLQAMDETPMLGARTTDKLNRENANKMIQKHGNEGTTTKLLSKKTKLSPAEVTAAQILAKQYSSNGTKEGLEKSIQLISKTAKEGREMGQALQALSQWNKLDETGAILMGERQVNRGVDKLEDWRSLTTDEAKPIQTAAQKIEQVQQTKSLADEVLEIVTNKPEGGFTPDEKALIQKFQQQVKEINSKTKGFLPKSKVNEVIKEVSQIPPKQRTRDNVVNYLDAKAELARKRIENRSNIGIVAELDNPVLDYAIIGAAHIAKNVRTYADYSELMVRDFGDAVKPYLKEAYVKSTNIFRKENGLPTEEQLDQIVNKAIKGNKIDKDTADSLKVMAKEIGYMSDEFKIEATQDLQKALKDLGESTLGQKLSTLQTSAQLLNAVTFERNAGGNAIQILLEKMTKMSAVPIDWGMSKLTGERTIQFLPMNQEKFWRNFWRGTKAGWNGVSPNGMLSSYDIHPEVFGKHNPLRYLTKTLGASLQGFDYASAKLAYGDVVATFAEQMGKAQGLSRAEIKKKMPELIKKLDNSIFDLADEAGLYATYQDETLLSNAAVMLKKGLNKITDKPVSMLTERGLLPKKLSTEGFGVGDIVLKYAKTPANLVMRGIDYSPFGLLRSTMELAPLVVNRSKFNQFEATRALGRAITGTLGLTGFGYILADVGVLSGSYSRDKDERSIQEQAGMGSYKVNWSALGRYLTSGFDKKQAKFQEGDNLMSYEWLQPAAISIAMGVNANKAMKDELDLSGWQVAQKAILGGLESVLENPMVQGLSNTVDAVTELVKNQKADKLKGMVKGTPASFVPTLLNQARSSTDNAQRETRDEKLLVEMLNLVKNKVPGLSITLPKSFDSLGNERERIQGGQSGSIGQYLTSFFSPAKFTKYEVSPEAKLVLDLLNESKDNKVLPRIAARTLEIDLPNGERESIKLTSKQYSELQKNVGEQTKALLKEYSDFLSDPNQPIEAKTKAIERILSLVGQVARNESRESMGFPMKQVR